MKKQLQTVLSGKWQGRLAVALLCLALSGGARAATLTVTKTADTNDGACNADCSLREAISAANAESGDAIVFASGVSGAINLTTALPNISSDMTLQGPGATSLEVTRNSGVFRIFTLTNGTSSGPTVTLSGLAITNGHAAGSYPTGDQGGGIWNDQGFLTVNNCVLDGNTGDYSGGGIYNTGTLTVSDSTFSNNSGATYGGGIYNTGTLTVNSCTFSDNTNSYAGGGLASDSGAPIVRNSTFSGNSAGVGNTYGYGGGFYNTNDEAIVSNCTFNGNTVSGSTSAGGGGIANINGTLTVRNGTLSANSATTGGGIYNRGITGFNVPNPVATLTVSNSTLSNNSATSGGGLYNLADNSGNAFVTLGNTILFSTSNTPGANLVNSGLGTSVTSQGFNLSSDDGGGFLTAQGDQINTDPMLGALQNNGGPTQTMALLTGSPAIDKGKNFGVTTDERGHARPLDVPTIANAAGGDGSDIGAVEMDIAQSGPLYLVNTNDDHADGTCSFADCTLREAILAANFHAGADTITFAANVTGVITVNPALHTLNPTDSTTIRGPGARILAISGNNAGGVFSFGPGATDTITGLTIRDGNVIGDLGFGGFAVGAGILNSATLTLANCTLSGNRVQAADSATAAGAGPEGRGGAIANTGTLTISNCTFTGNSAVGGRGGDGSQAINGHPNGGAGGIGSGAIYNYYAATLTIKNCTFSGNSATGGAGGNGQFGGNGGAGSAGVANFGTMSMTSCTFSGNSGIGGAGGTGNSRFNNGVAGAGSGGLMQAVATGNVVRDTISAGNGGADVNGAFTSGGYNLIGQSDGSTGFTNGTNHDKVGTKAAPINALLGPLQNNAGTTDTLALLPGSPAIDAAGSNSPSTDQRGITRPFDDPAVANAAGGNGSDIGAFELFTLGIAVNNPRSLPEGSAASPGSVTFAITLNGPSTQAVTVNYQTTNGTNNPAIAGSDYVEKHGKLTFAPGETSKLVTIKFIGDSVPELNETFFFDLLTPTGATILDGRGVGQINNDDGPAIMIDNAVAVVEGNSGTTPQKFIVSLSAAPVNTVTVNWTTADGTADTSDYVAASGTLSFAPGQTTRTITIQVKGDTLFEPSETYKVNLSKPVYAFIADSQGIGTIHNDDAAPQAFEDEPSQ